MTRSLTCLSALAALLGSLAAPAPAAQTDRPLFDAPVVAFDQLTRIEALLDLDADGHLDLLDWYYTTSTKDEIAIRGWINDGLGDFTPAWELLQPLDQNGELDHATGTGDVDGDGRDDFAIAHRSQLLVFKSNGAAAPTPWAALTQATPILDMELADFDADGLADVALLDGADVLRILLNGGQNQPLTESWSTVLASHSGDIRLIEADGDGLPDLMTARAHKVDMHVIVGGVRSQLLVHHHGIGPIDMHHSPQGDVDGDGDLDVVIFGEFVYRVLYRDGPSTWSFGPIDVGGPATHLADLDGDGAADGVCCSSSGGGGSGHGNKTASIYEIAMNDGTGVFADAFEMQGHGARHLAGAADIDADGDVDLVAGRSIYFAPGPITGEIHPVVEIPSFGALRPLIHDVDGDGDPDFMWDLDGLRENVGDGRLVTADVAADLPPTPLPGAQYAWAGPGLAGDWDGDGDQDLLLAWVEIVSQAPPFPDLHVFQSMRLLVNNGGGLLTDAGDATTPGLDMRSSSTCSYKQVGLAVDLDEDGDEDYISGGCTSYFWFNDGSGGFTQGAPAGGVPDQALDLDGDGHLDLVRGSTWVQVAYGFGDGSFAPYANLPVNPANWLTYGLGDLNDDGLVDVVGINPFDVLIFGWNLGNRVFTPDETQLLGFPPDPSGSPIVRVADVDADGLDDLLYGWAWGTYEATNIFVQLPGGAGFDDPVMQMVRPTGFVDVDGDGDLDGIGERIYRSLAFDGPGAGARAQYGPGMVEPPGVAFRAPVLGATGPFRQGETVVLRMSGMPVGAVGLMTVGFGDGTLPNLPWGNTHILNWPWALQFLVPVFGGDLGVPNGGVVALPFTVDAVTATAPPLHLQCFFDDTSVPSGFTATDGLMLDFD